MPSRGRPAPSGNLPFQLTSFVGRERERVEAARLLAGTRLLTLTGAGGVGKTRLALQVAADVAAGYRDGVCLVEFAALSDAALVPQAVAAALRVDEQPGRSILDLVGGYLRSRALLLLFDNCEHVLTTCASLAEALLRTCRDVRILATSREALGIAGETVWRVPSLGLPDPNEPPVPDRLAASESVRLFVERAAASQPGFRLTERNAAAVLQVCRRLDGLPLALELAAARVKGLPVEQIAARLDQGFRLLTDGSRTALPRHQTLRATMDWSYGLLSEAEQAVLRRLAVFGGGFTVESAEAVCADDAGGPIEAGAVLGLLLQLLDKSLVTAEEREGEARYHLLETVRQYAAGRLDDAGEAGRVRRRHAAWFLALAERAEAHLHGPAQVAWLRRLEAEHENLRAALESSGADPDGAETALRLAGALWPFWHMRGHFTEGRRSVERALARGAAAPPRVLPKALWCAGHLSWRQGRYDAAVEFNDRNLAVSGDVGDLMGKALGTLGNGLVALHRDDFAAADALFAQATGLFRQTGDRWWIATALNQDAFAAWYLSDRDRAAAYIAESLELLKGLGGPWGMAYMLRLTGHVAVARGEYARAASLYGEAFPLCREVGDRWVLNECVTGLSAAASALGRHEEAARLIGATGGLEETLGIQVPRSIAMMLDLERRRDSTRATLGSEAFAAAAGEGRAMDQERLVEYAAAQAAMLSRGAKASTKSPGAGSAALSSRIDAGPLTAREGEVAALVARGLTNREIAARLSIAERTIDAHVQHILNKLGFHSRAQIAAWAAERGLRGPDT